MCIRDRLFIACYCEFPFNAAVVLSERSASCTLALLESRRNSLRFGAHDGIRAVCSSAIKAAMLQLVRDCL